MSDLNLGEIEESCTKGWYSDKDIRPLVDNCKALIAEARRLRMEKSALNKKYKDLHEAFVYFDWMLTRWRDDCKILRRMKCLFEDIQHKRTTKSIHDVLREIGDERTVLLKSFKDWPYKEPGLITTNNMLNRKREIWDKIIALTPDVKDEEELLKAITLHAIEEAKGRGKAEALKEEKP